MCIKNILILCSTECGDLDLDGQGGKLLLRVLLNLVMHNYPPLVSGALQLLFRHFSQRQEVLQAFKQVREVTGCCMENCYMWPGTLTMGHMAFRCGQFFADNSAQAIHRGQSVEENKNILILLKMLKHTWQ